MQARVTESEDTTISYHHLARVIPASRSRFSRSRLDATFPSYFVRAFCLSCRAPRARAIGDTCRGTYLKLCQSSRESGIDYCAPARGALPKGFSINPRGLRRSARAVVASVAPSPASAHPSHLHRRRKSFSFDSLTW